MSITTKTGDKGTTGLFGGARVSKDSNIIEAIGNIDELSSAIGVIRSLVETNGRSSLQEIDKILAYIQNSCFVIGAQVASLEISNVQARHGVPVPAVSSSDTQKLEMWIEQFEKQLPELHHFILPSGHLVASQLFLTRAVCRRAERSVVRLNITELSDVLKFINRLSDLLFILARSVNQSENKKETIWSQ